MEANTIILITIIASFLIILTLGIIFAIVVFKKLKNIENNIILSKNETKENILEILKILNETPKNNSIELPQNALKQMEDRKEAERIAKIQLEYDEIVKTITSVESENIKNILTADLNKLIEKNTWLQQPQSENIGLKILRSEYVYPEIIQETKEIIVEEDIIQPSPIEEEIPISKKLSLPVFSKCRYCGKTYQNIETHEENCSE